MGSQPVRSLLLLIALTVLTVSAVGQSGNQRGVATTYPKGIYATSVELGQTAIEKTAPGSVGQAPHSAEQSSDLPRPGPAGASTIAIPILPFIIEYQYGKQYFVEKIYTDPVYIAIEAMLQDSGGPGPVYEVWMTEKEGHRKVYYTNSEARAAYLEASGRKAHVSQIEYKREESLGEEPQHIITFTDERGKLVRWTFVQASDLDEETMGVSLMARPLKVLYRDMASMAGEGTAVQIGDLTDKAKERPDLSQLPDLVAYEGTLCADPVIGGLVSGSQTWQVKAAPNAIDVGAEWLLESEPSYLRKLRVIAKNGNQITIQEAAADSPGSAPLTMIMNQTPEGLSLSSVAYADRKHILRLTFQPDLNIASVLRSGTKASLTFQLDLGGQIEAVSGTLEVEPKLNEVEVTGRLGAPDWAKSLVFKSRVALTAAGYKIACETVAPAS
jgi:hypothetical protein